MSTERLILFFGSARPGEYDTLLEAGLPLGLLRDTDSPNSRHRPSGFDVLEEMSFGAGVEELVARVAAIAAVRPVSCLPVFFEGHVEAAAEVGAALGLPGLSPVAALAARDKAIMHERLTAVLGETSVARQVAVADHDAAAAFAERVGFPVVVKPRRLHSSLYVTPCHDRAQLDTAVSRLLASVPQWMESGDADTTLLVEEYLEGSNHSVDVVAVAGLAWPTPVVDVVTGADLGMNDFQHFARIAPSALSAEAAAELQELAVRATQALDLSPGVSHVEMIRTAAGPRVVEVGGRPGGNRHRLLYVGHGVDLCRAYVDVLRGRIPDLEPTVGRAVAVATPYPLQSGLFRGFNGLERVSGLRSVRTVSERVAPGDLVGSPRDGSRSPLSVELQAAERHLVTADLARLAEIRRDLFDLVEVAGHGVRS